MKTAAVASKYDQVIFTWCFGNKWQGIIAAQVDDFWFVRSEIFQLVTGFAMYLQFNLKKLLSSGTYDKT